MVCEISQMVCEISQMVCEISQKTLRDIAKDFARYRKDFARSRKRLCEISQNSLRDIANQLPQPSFTNGPCNSHSSMINRTPENNHGGGFRAFPSVQRGPKRGHHANAKRQGGQEFNLTEVGLGSLL